MTGRSEFVRWQTLSAEPLETQHGTVTLRSQMVAVRWPGGGWVWNRPTSVIITREDGIQEVPILDITRIGQITLFGLGALFLGISLLLALGTRR